MEAMAKGSAEKSVTAPAPAGLTGGLKFYRFSAYVTGILLLLLTIEMIAKYGYGMEVEMFGDRGMVAFVPDGQVEAFNFSQAILIAHGWFYVVYLFASFRVWTMMRWPFWRFLWLASGGLFPFLSFFIEHYATIVIRRRIDESATS
jgi:integral membrane protein